MYVRLCSHLTFILCLLFFFATTGETKSKYLGCYFDEFPARRLTSKFKDFGKQLTQQTCIDYCKGKGHLYAGVQSSTQCFCGNWRQKPSTDDLRSEIECDYKCSGDQTQTCGGDWRNSIYETGLTGETNPNYLGCYFDEHVRRFVTLFKDFGIHLTKPACIDHCKGKGYPYTAVQASTHCFCGDWWEIPSTKDLRPETECNFQCTGDHSQICGGAWRNSIYETGLTGKTGFKYLGCYFDEDPGRRLNSGFRDFGKYLTQQACVAYCKDKGHPYAGVQSSTQCFCGSHREKPNPVDLKPEHECNYKCTGDKSQICGGHWRNAVYETGIPGETTAKYLGCYFDEDPGRRLINDFKEFGIYHSQQKCLDYCKSKGRLYTGVQSSTQCFCGDQKPNTEDLRPETECNYTCSADRSRICGGHWRNSIYETGIKGGNGNRYLGCYFDEEVPDRRLPSDFKDFSKSHTQQACIEYCKNKGYLFAGVQSSTQCFCGDRRPSSDDSRPETECSYKCTGDQAQICGGHWRNSVYETGVGETKSIYLGCYFDGFPTRRLTSDFKDFGKYLTKQTCIDYCKSKGHLYAGLQSSTKCLCGNWRQKPTTVDLRAETECSNKCSGDKTQTCGADRRNSIYETGLPGEANPNYLGCYFDESPARRLISEFKDLKIFLTKQTCIDYCKDRGHPYAGMQASSLCFCGDWGQRPSAEDLRPESECNSRCSADRSQICGGPWRNSIYETGLTGKTSFKYLGCYFDKDPGRRLVGDLIDLGNYNTQQLCVAYCKDRGHTYAGVQSSTQCFCGTHRDTPNPGDLKPEHECNYKCPGDKSQICGGHWRNSVYETGLPVETTAKYLGCYFDEDPGRRLIKDFKDFGKYLTQQTCVDYCKSKGYLYTGVQASTKCFCGDRKPSTDDSRSEAECNNQCSGDHSRICGGDWRNSIYETGLQVGTGYRYLGCYFDEHPDRRLVSDFKDFGQSLTQQECIDYCKNKGYSFAGVQSSSQCFCGDHRPETDDSRLETECSYKCTGDQAQVCGGKWRNSVYETGEPEPLTDRRYDYVGCFVDQEPKALSGYSTDLGNNNSPEKCIDLCTLKGYVYAGLQSKSQCFCGDEHPVPDKRAGHNDCKYRCPGDKHFICGGDWKNAIYKTGNLDSLVSDSRYEYLGCYMDQEPRELRGPSQDIGNQNSPERCVTLCKKQGYVYAGLQDTTHCFCGDQDPKIEKRVDAKQCKYKCPGDYRFICGGDWRNTVYKTGHPGASVDLTGYEYVGCYRDQAEPRLLPGEMLDFPETLTPSLCVGICKKRGYVYAGLQLSSQCFCGDNEVMDSYKADEEDCHMKCTGDRTSICGGSWRLTLYKTGNKAPSLAKLDGNEYVGCYRDQIEPRLLQGHSQVFPETLTPKLCVALCKRKGYVYAGLQTSSECFCGDEELPDSTKVSDSDCTAKCTGDRSVFCGGTWRITVYKTGNSGSSVATIGYEYMGCYIDVSYPRKLNGFLGEYPETLTPQHCVTVCKQKGFLFAGLQRGFQCFCGNEFPSNRDKRRESDCNSKCRGDLAAICGGGWRNTIYKTGNRNDNSVENTCLTSVTRVNGKAACFNEVVFEEKFDSLSAENWTHVVQIPNEPDYPFVIYKSDPANAYTADGKLVIKPTLLSDSEVKNGDLHLENCTGKPDKGECGYKARSYIILPPVQSAHLTTRKSFSFQYGKVEISAKLPAGDWLVPEIRLEPKKEVYGPGYVSGSVRIAMSRGNNNLKLYSKDIGCKHLESGILMGVGDNIRGRTVIRETSDGWDNSYHNFSVIWTPENILFSVDGGQPFSLVPNGGQTLPEVVGFTPDVTPVWSSASRIAPFDSDFYISLGVTVGGIRNFPDSVMNNGKPKPWKNLELKAMLNFWRDKVSWLPTWHDDTALLKVDYVKVTAL